MSKNLSKLWKDDNKMVRSDEESKIGEFEKVVEVEYMK
jgi:hypothetical protein